MLEAGKPTQKEDLDGTPKVPLPKPTPGESRDDFMARCMGSDRTKEFDTHDQQVAVCLSTYARTHGEEVSAKNADFFNHYKRYHNLFKAAGTPAARMTGLPMGMREHEDTQERAALAEMDAKAANDAAQTRYNERRKRAKNQAQLFAAAARSRNRVTSMQLPKPKQELGKALNREIVKRNALATRFRALQKRWQEGDQTQEELCKSLHNELRAKDLVLDMLERRLEK